MPKSENGPIWGGASVEWQKKKKEEREMAVKDMSILFDTDNFHELHTHLNLLEDAGIKDIQLANKEYSITIIKKIVEKIIEDFSDETRQKKVREGVLTDERIIQYLKERGVTGNKIAPDSLQGFRECMLLCIKTMSKKKA